MSFKSDKWNFQALLMILTWLETLKLTSLATHPLPDQLHQQNKGEASILLPLPSGPSTIHVALQGSHEVELLFLIPSGYRFPKMETTFKMSAQTGKTL